jgi:type III restriction enzyme
MPFVCYWLNVSLMSSNETHAWGPRLRETVSLDSPAMIKAIASNVAMYVTIKTFTAALRNLVVETLTPQLNHIGRKLCETQGFPYSRPTFAASKCVFNLVACDNTFEQRFARFLQSAPDVTAFAKLPSQFGFSIEYTDNALNLRYYEPDFVAAIDDGSFALLQTKGREDIDVAYKDRAARLRCENAILLTGTTWNYIKIPQADFDQLQPDAYSDIHVFAG